VTLQTLAYALEFSHSFLLTPFSTFLTEEEALIKPARNPLPSQWHTQGMMCVPHTIDSRKLIFPLHLFKEHRPLSSSGSPWNSHSLFLLLFRPSLQMFLLLHFLLAQKLLEGFCRDSSDSSIRALPISSWPLNNSLLSFLEHLSLFLLIIEDGACNVSSRLFQRALLFPSGLLHYYHHDFCSHPHTDLSFTKKTVAEKKLSHKFRKC